MDSLQSRLETLAKAGASCSGRVPDFETVRVVLSYDSRDDAWVLHCG